jgi:hypothetical protein
MGILFRLKTLIVVPIADGRAIFESASSIVWVKTIGDERLEYPVAKRAEIWPLGRTAKRWQALLV